MQSSRAIGIPLLLIVFANAAYAGTVTWTGTCGGAPINSSVYFKLTNSGNDSAYNVVLTPALLDARTSNSSYDLGTVASNSSNSLFMKLVNISGTGTFADYYMLSYQQDSSSFAAVFPCLLTLGNTPTTSSLNVSVRTSATNSSVSNVTVLVLNPSAFSINANITIVLPQTFSVSPNRTMIIALGPNKERSMSFSVKAPVGSSGSYSGAIAANYKLNGLAYGTLHTFLISKQASQTAATLDPTLIAEILIILAAVILAAMIVRLILRKRKR